MHSWAHLTMAITAVAMLAVGWGFHDCRCIAVRAKVTAMGILRVSVRVWVRVSMRIRSRATVCSWVKAWG